MKKKRIVIIGSSGIISTNLQKRLKLHNFNFLVFGRKKIDLKRKNSHKVLEKKIKNNDIVIFISAEAPVKNMEMFFNNIEICNNFCKSLNNKVISKLIYISSDAVYSDISKKINENSKTIPNSMHGSMHLMREMILKVKFKEKLCILRPTLIYGLGDTHNGYGPNKFVNLAKKNKDIVLFGKGEERRDHIHIEDLINILFECIKRKKNGIFNIATGKVNSFHKIAKKTVSSMSSKSKILFSKRVGKMPHNGYRPFNINLLKKNFKNLRINSIDKGIKKYLKDLKL
tara:strand:+ start:1286 stop:2140 length:855 start_codon:yes stop_codon:yes gene_type:complete